MPTPSIDDHLAAAAGAEKAGDWALADRHHAAVLELRPQTAYCHQRRGWIAYLRGDWPAAVAHQQQAVHHAPGWFEGYWHLAVALHEWRRYEEALEPMQAACGLRPDLARLWSHLGKMARNARAVDLADQAYAHARQLDPEDPEILYSHSLHLLKQGRWQQGWHAFEARFDGSDRAGLDQRAPYPGVPVWQGEAFARPARLIVRHEQGFGDCLMMLRFHSDLRARFDSLHYELPPSLCALATQSLPDAHVGPPGCWTGQAEDGMPTWQVPIMSLPACFHATPPALSAMPYLRADPALVRQWRQRWSDIRGRRIGLLWHVGAVTRVTGRTIDVEDLLPLADIDDCCWISLSTQALPAPLQPWVRDCHADLFDFHQTAALVHTLDLVISVDTAVAHVAGGLGRPLWVMNRYEGDWRWGNQVYPTPWYPDAELFNQPTPGDWRIPMNAVVARLRGMSY